MKNEHGVSSPVDASLSCNTYGGTHCCIFKSTALREEVLHYNEHTTKYKQILCRFQRKLFERQKKFFRCLAPGQANLCAATHPVSIVVVVAESARVLRQRSTIAKQIKFGNLSSQEILVVT